MILTKCYLDLQMVDVTVRVLTKPKEKNLIKLYRTLSTDYDERVLPGIVNEILKSVIVSLGTGSDLNSRPNPARFYRKMLTRIEQAQFTAAQLIIRREDVSRMIERSLTKRADDFNIAIENVAIVSTRYSVYIIASGYILTLYIRRLNFNSAKSTPLPSKQNKSVSQSDLALPSICSVQIVRELCSKFIVPRYKVFLRL